MLEDEKELREQAYGKATIGLLATLLMKKPSSPLAKRIDDAYRSDTGSIKVREPVDPTHATPSLLIVMKENRDADEEQVRVYVRVLDPKLIDLNTSASPTHPDCSLRDEKGEWH